MSRFAEKHFFPMPANDGLPDLEPLCAEQSALAQAYADVLAVVGSKVAAANNEDRVGLTILLARLQYDALWAVSEVSKTPATKLRRQRYISQDVFDRWQELTARNKTPLGDFHKDNDGQTLIHEHVFNRKSLGLKLKGCSDVTQIAKVPESVTACVVSKAEDKRLRNVNNYDGWDRYRRAEPPIGVYDRKQRCWHIQRSPAQVSQSGAPCTK
jgi:hypothetical protein